MTESAQEFSGRIALVTGGGSGIGKEICRNLAADGALVVVCDLNIAAAKETAQSLPGSVKHLAKVVNVADSASVKELLSQVEKEVGTPDILMNCAGIKINHTLVEMPEAAFDKVMDVNLKGTFLMTQEFSKLMIRNQVSNGAIVNISSMSADLGFHANYSSSKAAVEALTKNTARELGKHGIRCNAVSPGIIITPLNDDMTPEMLEKFRSRTPLGRNGKAEDIAEVCKFLVSNKSAFVTGAIIKVSGGLHM